jgi:hypothetical protein
MVTEVATFAVWIFEVAASRTAATGSADTGSGLWEQPAVDAPMHAASANTTPGRNAAECFEFCGVTAFTVVTSGTQM